MSFGAQAHAQASGDPVTISALHKRFGALEVLKGIDMAIGAGKTVGVIGPSGSGKSTLVRCINHLEPIQQGRISVGVNGTTVTARGVENAGRVLSQGEVARYRAQIGMVFQSFNLFPHLTVLGNILTAPVGVLKRDKKAMIEKGMELLGKVNLQDKAKTYPAHLSGGQQQRVAIVRALMMDPKVMLFDEPTSALDPELTGEVLKVIAELAIRGRTTIIVTHELAFARDIADAIVFMDNGKIVEEGTPDEVLGNPKMERTRAFIGKMA
ncbi:MAG: amino acid ABC transporter ATP-binding protein [Alphaproteobacteria bacterium]|nr:amino acid ABC transporter ATP-binding protein [Alphaproteobacteria bacterium]